MSGNNRKIYIGHHLCFFELKMARIYQKLLKPLVYAGLAAIALSPAAGCREKAIEQAMATPGITQTVASSPQCTLNFHQVKAGSISPRAYLSEMEHCLPEAADAHASGMLGGFLYQPSDSELEQVLTGLFSGRPEEEVQAIVQANIDSYNELEGDAAGTILPAIAGAFGQGTPVYVAFKEKLFSSPQINNDADVRSIIIHEVQHVKDWYAGIDLPGMHLSYNTISPETISKDFLEHLLEFRAVYAELEDIFRERVDTGSSPVSPEWFGSRAEDYFLYWTFIEKRPTTELETRIREAQLGQYQGIVPEIREGELLIKFDLFGKQDVLYLKQRSPDSDCSEAKKLNQ